MTSPRSLSFRFKTLAAALGAGSVVTMGVLAAAGGTTADAGTTPYSPAGMQVGETTTVTYTGTIVPVKAAPAVKAPPYGKK